MLADRDAAGVERESARLGPPARAVAMDVTAEDDVSAAFADLAAAGWTPDVVVANAAVQLFGSDAPIADLDLAVWQRTVDVNLTGTFLTVKHAVRALLLAGGGAIILTGSPTAVSGEGQRLHGLQRIEGRSARTGARRRRGICDRGTA